MPVAAMGLAALAVLGTAALRFGAAAQAQETGARNKSSVASSAQVDTSKPGWYQEAMAADAELPRTNKVVNGIAIGPSEETTLAGCHSDELEPLEGEKLADGGWGAAKPAIGALPDGASLEAEMGLACGPQLVWYEASFTLPFDQRDREAVASGEISWFDTRHGGFVEVRRIRAAAPVIQLAAADARVEADSINGHAAVTVAPVFPQGFGEGSVTSWDGEFLTTVTGMHVATEDLRRIAQEVK
jgi:hypothetical protein